MLYCQPKNAATATPAHKKATVSNASWPGVLDFLGSWSGMGISGVLLKGTFHPAPAIGPFPAALKRNRFHEVIIHSRSMLKPNEIAAWAIEFFTLR